MFGSIFKNNKSSLYHYWNARVVLVVLISFILIISPAFAAYRIQAKQAWIDTPDFPDRDYVERLLALAHMPGFAVGIINENGALDTYMFGETTLNTGIEPNKDTIFLGGSLSKTITATAIMQLVEQGKILLDEDVSTYLPFQLRHPSYPEIPITVRMLLTHTAGFTNVQWRTFIYFSVLKYPLAWFDQYLMPGGMIYHEDNWNDYPPGEGIYYSSIGFDLLAFIVERVSDIPFETYCKHHIFEPLQMENTSYNLEDVSLDQFTSIYGYLFGKYIPLPYYEIINDGSGGVYTTIEDISHFLSAHMNNGTYGSAQILTSESIQLMHTPQTIGIPAYDIYRDGRNHGLGWIVWPDDNSSYEHGLQGHLGNVPGGLASMTVMNQNGVVFFGNEWFRISYSQTFIMFFLREYFHTKIKPIEIERLIEHIHFDYSH